MNDPERLNDIAIELKRVKEHIGWIKDMDEGFSPIYKGDTTKSRIQIKDLENRRKRIVNRMHKKYCT